MIINNWNFKIGTEAGQYLAGVNLTDSMIAMGEIAAISHGGSYFASGFTVDGNYMHFGDVITTSNGDTLQIIYKHPIEIKRNDV